MRKKFLLGLILFTFFLPLLACTEKKPVDVPTSKTADTSVHPRDDDINIKHPTFPEHGIDINKIIEREANLALNWYDLSPLYPDDKLSIKIEYEIKMETVDLLSIVFYGTGFVSGSAHPNELFYTLNLNPVTGEKIRLVDKVKVDDLFLRNLRQQAKATLDDRLYGAFVLNYGTDEQLRAYLLTADTLDKGIENQSNVFSYFTTTSVGISLPIGDFHVEIEMPS